LILKILATKHNVTDETDDRRTDLDLESTDERN